MSATLHIRFTDDMPTAVVEVISPDLKTVELVALEPGGETTVEVPSEKSFIRLHLPSGRDVTLHHEGSLSYLIGRDTFEKRYERSTPGRTSKGRQSVRDVRSYHQFRSAAAYKSTSTAGSRLPPEMYGAQPEDVTRAGDGAPPVLPGGVKAVWTPEVDGRLSLDGSELDFEPSWIETPYELRLDIANAGALVVSLPGNIASAYVRSDGVGTSGRIVSVRVSTHSAVADTVGSYLARGDYFASSTMTGWADQAEEALQSKVQDPFAATVAGYLLLRLERFDLMRNWARNLADWFPNMSDGCIIWATQCVIDRDRADREQAEVYFNMAVNRGLPVYTEGLHLLSKNLRRMGKPGQEALDSLGKETGRVVWNSPFTARLMGPSGTSEAPISFDIGYAPSA